MWESLCSNMDKTESERTECILLYSFQCLPHLLFLICLLCSPYIYKIFRWKNQEQPKNDINIRNWMYFYNLKLPLWVSTLLLSMGSLGFALYPIFDIQAKSTGDKEQFDYDTVHPDHKYFISPCFLIVFLLSFLVWGVHSRYISYSYLSLIFAMFTGLGGGVLLSYTIMLWEDVQPRAVRPYLVAYYVLQSLMPFMLICSSCSKTYIPKTKNQKKCKKFWDDSINERIEYIQVHGMKNYDKQYSSYERAGFINKLIFSFIIPLFRKGNKKAIELSDIEAVPMKVRAEAYYYSLKDVLAENKESKYKLIYSIIKAYKGEEIMNCVLGFITISANFLLPLFVYTFNQFFLSDEPEIKGYLLALLFILYITLFSLTWCIFDIHEHTNYISIWSSLSHLIYSKTLKLASKSRQKYTEGEITNLLSVDARIAAEGISFMKNLTFLPLQIMVTLYLIYRLVGWIFVLGVGVVIIGGIVSSIFTNYEAKNNEAKKSLIDKRMKDTGAFINNAKLIKMYAWEEKFLNKINVTRKTEMYIRKIEMVFRTLISVLYFSVPLQITLSIFAYYYATSEELNSTIVFTLLSYIEIIRDPITWLAYTISTMIQGYVSQSRILAFISCKEINTEGVTRNSNQEGEIALTIQGSYKWEEEDTDIKSSQIGEIKMNKETEIRALNNHDHDDIHTQNESTDSVPKFSLSDINLYIEKGEFIAIVGATASGKSSLLSCILGELLPTDPESHIYINGLLAYSGQNPWIQNTTFRDNILFGGEYKHNKFSEIMRICGLDIDLAAFPKGENTLIGEKGITLSGGQKARVALARAIYSEQDIYLLDDVLSAVDAHVAKLIMGDCLLNYLGGYTRVLVTHNLQILPDVDRIIVLKEGKVVGFDTFSRLMKGEEFRLNYEEYIRVVTKEGGLGGKCTDTDTGTHLGVGGDNLGDIMLEGLNDIEAVELKLKKELSEHLSEHPQNSVKVNEYKSEHKMEGEVNEEEDRNIGKVTCSMYQKFGSALRYPMFVLLVLLFFILNGIWRVSDYMLVKWVEISEEGGEKEDYAPYAITFFAIGAFYPFYMFAIFIINHFSMLVVSKKMHIDMLTRIAYAPINLFFDITPAGRILNRISKDLDFLDNRFSSKFEGLFLCLSAVVGMGIFNIIAIPFSVLGMPIILLSGYYFQKFYLKTSREISRLKSIGRSPLVQHFTECVTGSEVIRAYNYSNKFKRKNLEILSDSMRPEFAFITGMCLNSIATRLICCIWVTILMFCLIKYRDNLSAGYSTLILTYIYTIVDCLYWFFTMLSEMETAMVSFERCDAYTKIPQEASQESKTQIPTSWPSSGRINIEDYSFKYRPNTEIVLKNITAEIKGGEKIGIVGRTGAGKSSLTLGLLRIVEGNGGKIFIDQINIQDIGLRDLRTSVTIIPQDGLLFNGTIRENLDPFDEFTDLVIEDVIEKVKLSGLTKEQGGLKTEIKDNGENMSNGEKQLVSIARAILKKSKIILLDEATASLDMELDDLIQTLIKTEFSDSTLITIAHRIHTILHYDRIIVLDDGKIAEFDTPQNLLNQENSIFAMLVKEATHYCKQT